MQKMKNILLLITVFVLLFSAKISTAQQAEAWSSLDSTSIMIGDQIHYNIGITLPKDAFVQWPLYNDTITQNIEIINRSNIDTIATEHDIMLSQMFVITSFDSGYFEVPVVDFKFAFANDTTVFTASSMPLFLNVMVPVVDTTQAFKPIVSPISEPYTIGEVLPWIVVITAVIIVIVLGIFYLSRRKKKQPIFSRKAAPLLPPHIVAINKLEELRLAKMWQSGHLKKYHSEITDILREYLDRRYNFDAPEMTTYEIVSKLNELKVNKEALSKIENVMNLADLVKFAKSVPTAVENDLSLVHSTDFVNETKMVEEVKQDEIEENNEHLTKAEGDV